jgi:2-hydroxymuconate-semialdehyde hydrolase
MADNNPEIANSVVANGIKTNYHDQGSGDVVVLVHGSGPGVSAWANWRLTMPDLSPRLRVIAPDMVGFGFTDRPEGVQYNIDTWASHLIGLFDALNIERAHLVGNSFGAALALATAIRHPERVNRLVLMGAMGIHQSIPEGLDAVWGYEPSRENMRKLVNLFAYNKEIVTDDLVDLRYNGSIRPGFQESFSAMFPAPRQRWVDAMASEDKDIAALPNETLVIHGREDQVLPFSNALRLHELINRSQLHIFGRCGHWTQIEHAKRFNELVADFLTEA